MLWLMLLLENPELRLLLATVAVLFLFLQHRFLMLSQQFMLSL